jgi:hypothetical protein
MKTLNERLSLGVGVVCFTLAASGTAHALCAETGVSNADNDLWNTHGCWQDFFLWSKRAYDQRQGDWQSGGWLDACNRVRDFPKHWNAAYLVTYGLRDNPAQSFHGTVDYRATGEAASGLFHNRFYHSIINNPGVFGSFSPGFWAWETDRVATSCPLYDLGLVNSNPASRAGDFVHEGWHAWMRSRGYGGHFATGCAAAGGCDYFYVHGIGEYAFGALWQTDGTAERFHSPNQAQVEFLCDVADQSESWVPASVRLTAASDANQRAVQRFINGPGYRCGNARPW